MCTTRYIRQISILCILSFYFFNPSGIYAEKDSSLKKIIRKLDQIPVEIQDMILSKLMPQVQKYLELCMLKQPKKSMFKELKGHNGWVGSVVFSPDESKLASGSYDGTIKLWDVATGQELQTIKGYDGCVNSVTFSPDGRKLASGSRDGTIKLWDLATGEELQTLEGLNSLVYSVTFSLDESKLASGSDDKTIKLWDVTTGEKLQTIRGHNGLVNSVTFSPDGSKLAG